MTRWQPPWWVLPGFAGLLALTQVVLWILVIPLLREQGARSVQGRQARVQQCVFRPLTLKEQGWFRARGVITGDEFRMIRMALPSAADCRAVLRQK